MIYCLVVDGVQWYTCLKILVREKRIPVTVDIHRHHPLLEKLFWTALHTLEEDADC